jgi:hypothetical protein
LSRHGQETLVDDSIVITDSNAILVLRHGAQ